MDKIDQKFVGVWELDEWVVEKPNGDKTFPFSGNADGFLIYHPCLLYTSDAADE